MSRSYKKTPGYTDHVRSTWKDKRFANKKVRNSEIVDGGMYKKVFESWKICDYKTLVFRHPDYNDDYRASTK